MMSKSKNKLVILILKISIVLLAFYFIYTQITKKNNFNWTDFVGIIQNKFSFGIISALLFLSFLNRYLEILKWKNLVSYIAPISIFEATKQVLAALTSGIITPNGIGEYAGKVLFFEKSKSKIIIFLNLICNGIQMILTILFGLFGLIVLGYYEIAFTLFGISIVVLVIVFLTKNFKIKNFSIASVLQKTNEIPKKIHQRNMFLGLSRYVVFSHQYYLLFVVLDVHLPYITLISTIAVVYFLASSLPSFQMFDFAVKGSVALFFFGKHDINEWIILFVSTLMWFLNVVLPVLIGSFFVLNFKSKWK